MGPAAKSRAVHAVLPPGWPRPHGYSHGMLAPPGRSLLFVAGQIASDASGHLVGASFVEQFEQALRNCLTVVEAAGGTASDIVRLTMFCPAADLYRGATREVGLAYRRLMGGHYPAMSLVEVRALLEAGALIEIEATASVPEAPRTTGRLP